MIRGNSPNDTIDSSIHRQADSSLVEPARTLQKLGHQRGRKARKKKKKRMEAKKTKARFSNTRAEILVLFHTAAESPAHRSHVMESMIWGDSLGDGPKGILLF